MYFPYPVREASLMQDNETQWSKYCQVSDRTSILGEMPQFTPTWGEYAELWLNYWAQIKRPINPTCLLWLLLLGKNYSLSIFVILAGFNLSIRSHSHIFVVKNKTYHKICQIKVLFNRSMFQNTSFYHPNTSRNKELWSQQDFEKLIIVFLFTIKLLLQQCLHRSKKTELN